MTPCRPCRSWSPTSSAEPDRPRRVGGIVGVLTITLAIILAQAVAEETPPSPPEAVPAIAPAPAEPPIVSPQRAESTPGPTMMEDIAVTADEPRYVAPTLRDRIGR